MTTRPALIVFVAILGLSMSPLQASAANYSGEVGRLPVEIRAMLDQRYPGWHVFSSAEAVANICTNDGRAHSIIRGDFDGDGQIDYAAIVVRGEKRDVLAFMRRGAGYRQIYVAEGPGVLQVTRAGTSYVTTNEGEHAPRRVFIKNDAIVLSLCEADSEQYVFQGGRFTYHE